MKAVPSVPQTAFAEDPLSELDGRLPGDPEPCRPIEGRDDVQREGAALDQLEHQEVGAGSLDVVVDPADVGVDELREHARFAQKAGTGTWIEPVLGTDCLERAPPLEALAEADLNLSHPAAADVTDDADVTDRRADEAHVRPFRCLSSL